MARKLGRSDADRVAGVYFFVDRPRYMHARTFERMKRDLARLEREEAHAAMIMWNRTLSSLRGVRQVC